MPESITPLKRRLDAGKLARAMEVLLWHFAYRRPKDTVEIQQFGMKTDEKLKR